MNRNYKEELQDVTESYKEECEQKHKKYQQMKKMDQFSKDILKDIDESCKK